MYLVNPSSGVVEANKSFSLLIRSKITKDKVCKKSDKFLVQYIGASIDANAKADEISAFLTTNSKMCIT